MALSPLYLALLRVYHYFPLHSPVTLWLVNGAWGRFSAKGGKAGWYLDGNKAWAAMEVVSVSRLRFFLSVPGVRADADSSGSTSSYCPVE